MKAGDILLFKAEKDWLSKLIAWGTNSVYSHVAVCVSSEMSLTIEALTRGGVKARDIRRIEEAYDVYRVKGEHPYDVNKALSYLVGTLNNRYDYFGVMFLGLLKLLAKIGIPLKETANKWQIEKDYFCSELCYEAFIFAGLDIVPEVPEADITSPGDIAKSAIVQQIER